MTNSKEPRLDPCPFCGGTELESFSTSNAAGGSAWTIGCKNCPGEVWLLAYDQIETEKLWNTRPTPKAAPVGERPNPPEFEKGAVIDDNVARILWTRYAKELEKYATTLETTNAALRARVEGVEGENARLKRENLELATKLHDSRTDKSSLEQRIAGLEKAQEEAYKILDLIRFCAYCNKDAHAALAALRTPPAPQPDKEKP